MMANMQQDVVIAVGLYMKNWQGAIDFVHTAERKKMKKLLKMWFVTDRYGESEETYETFADTAGKAKSYALYNDYFEGCSFTDLRAVRYKPLDMEEEVDV